MLTLLPAPPRAAASDSFGLLDAAPRAAVVYAREAPETQADARWAIEQQLHRVRVWAASACVFLGPPIEEITLPRCAGFTPGALLALQQATQAPRGLLVVDSLCRLCRSPVDALALYDLLRRSGAHLVSVSDRIDSRNPAGLFPARLSLNP
jgi:DNA invertase Pin-like site-specific DNA recombinase